jgi:hypothetical protein
LLALLLWVALLLDCSVLLIWIISNGVFARIVIVSLQVRLIAHATHSSRDSLLTPAMHTPVAARIGGPSAATLARPLCSRGASSLC